MLESMEVSVLPRLGVIHCAVSDGGVECRFDHAVRVKGFKANNVDAGPHVMDRIAKHSGSDNRT